MDFDRDVLSALAEVEQLSKMVIRPTALAFARSDQLEEDREGRNQF